MVTNSERMEAVMIVVEISCEEVWRELSEYIDETLESAMHNRLQLHLSHCAHCRAVYDGTKNIVALVADEELFTLPRGFGERLMRHIALQA